MDGKIAVTTEGLMKKKEEWLDFLRQMEADFTEMEGLLSQLDQYFMGSPVETIKSRGLKRQEEGMNCLKQLENHLEKLSKIHRVYEQAERSSQDAVADNRTSL